MFQVLTKDSVTVSVDAVVYYRVSNATVSVANVENAHHSTRLLAQTTLRNILGTKNLHEILSDRESISGSMQVCYIQLKEKLSISNIKFNDFHKNELYQLSKNLYFSGSYVLTFQENLFYLKKLNVF